MVSVSVSPLRTKRTDSTVWPWAATFFSSRREVTRLGSPLAATGSALTGSTIASLGSGAALGSSSVRADFWASPTETTTALPCAFTS